MHILSSADLNKELLEDLFYQASAVRDHDVSQPLCRRILATIFLEPSTRTRLSFEAAMVKLGGHSISVPDGQGCSDAKGESLYDTIMTVAQYVDVIVLRSSEQIPDLKNCPCPVINGGDGSNEHPTQAILDVFTIWDYFRDLSNIKVGVAGDVEKSRTIRSFCNVMTNVYGNQPKVYDSIRGDYAQWQEFQDLLPTFDVLYMNRAQKERHTENVHDTFGLYHYDLPRLKEKMIVLHPGPRQGELSADLDGDSRIKFFEQAKNGLHVRMAVLKRVLGS